MAKRNARNLIIIKDWIFSLLKQFNFLLNIQKDYKLLMNSYEKLKVIPKEQKWSQKPSRSFLFLFICFMFVLFFSFYILSCFFLYVLCSFFFFRFISYHAPFGAQRPSIYTNEGRSPELCGWVDGWVDEWWFFTPFDFPHF